MVQVHVTGIDTTNNDLINNLIGNVLNVFPNIVSTNINIPDNSTLDIYIEVGV